MAIDLSQLPVEQQAFLKAHPELLKALENEVPKQVSRFQAREKARASWQKQYEDDPRVKQAMDKADELRRQYDPELMRINDLFLKQAIATRARICPQCGEGDMGNKMNGAPWCVKCNVVLVSKENADKWLKIRPISKFEGLKRDFEDLTGGT